MTDAAQIYDRGYRAYEGERAGTAGAIRSVFIASVQRALGLRRAFRFKIVPIITILISYLPAVVFAGVVILIPATRDDLLADYAGYFGFIGIAIALLTAFISPELLISDRRTGLFGMYMASPLSKWDYLVSKLSALVSVLLSVTLFPVLFLLIGYMVGGVGPDGFGATVEVIAKILLSGVFVALYYALIGAAGSAVATRQGFASAGIIVVLVASTLFAEILLELGDSPDWVGLISLPSQPLDLVSRLFDEQEGLIEGISVGESLGATTLVMGICAATIFFSYRRVEVTK